LTERRLASGFDENQTFVAIFNSRVSKMQHSNDGSVRLRHCRLEGAPSRLFLAIDSLCPLTGPTKQGVARSDKAKPSACYLGRRLRALSVNPFVLVFADYIAPDVKLTGRAQNYPMV
jgi:hypothetical protein